MSKFFLALLTMWSMAVVAETKTYELDSVFNGMEKAEFVTVDTQYGPVLKGRLVGGNEKNYELPDTCEPEGGNAVLTDAYVVKGEYSYFLFTCAWSVQHPGIALSGTQYKTFVYPVNSLNTISKNLMLSQSLSGYEGSLEEGARSYAWYTERKLAKDKILELEAGKKIDSLALAHRIVLKRLKDKDYDAISYYLSPEQIGHMKANSPISKITAPIYNDFGFALSESGESDLAYSLLKDVEAVSPDRVVLKLNIADVLWVSDKEKSKLYYKNYIETMQAAGKEKLIPQRAFERRALN
ncbi:hypothetical protein [Pseudomonas cichorii]|uniref:hypothetical protein n=1 Tax=Pseudomonas cichorii TaxID=36746 RepID=UPI0011C3E0A5|nr:hypothetical protein [Pseudomonas cichorii]